MPERSGFLGHARTIGLCTLLSRVLGMVRDILCAALFGTHWVWDAFSFAFRAPNLFRRLFGEGAMSGAFIPVFTEYLETKPREEAWLMLGKVFTALLTALLSIVLIGELAFIVAPFLHEFQPTGSLALKLLLIMFPYLLFICLVALAMGILNSLGHFFMPAFSPAMLNVCWIAAIGFVYFGPQMTPERKVFVLALAILFAGVVQLAMQVPVLRKLGVPIRLDFRFDHPAVKQVARLWAPVVFGMGIVQLNVLMDGLIAIGFSHQPGGPDSFSLFGLTIRYPMQEGANSTLYFAERLYQLPLSVLGTAMATAVLPTFSRHFARGDHEGLAATLSLALRVIFFVGVPASVAIMVLSEPMVDLLFKRGKFTEQSVERTAMVVLFYASGIWAYCGLQVLVRAFHAMQDTKTPVTVGASMVAANVAMNLTFIWFLREAGLALATALSAMFQIAILFRLLRRKLGAKLGVRDTLGSLAKTAAASVAMAVACWLTLKFMPAPVGLTVRALRVFAPLAVGGAVFVASAWLLRTAELSLVLKAASKR